MDNKFVVFIILVFILIISYLLLPVWQLIKKKRLPEISISDLDKSKAYDVLGSNKSGLILRERRIKNAE